MPDNLTGEFDVVAEFAVAAVDRLLAAMHRCERFPHSLSVRVDDKPRPGRGPHAAVEAVDAFGDAVVDHTRVGHPRPWPGPLAATSAVHAGLGMLVNGDALTAELPPLVPSNLAGIAQVQLGPPTVEITDGAGAKLTARLPLRARYRPDPQTARAAEFVHGELRLTAAINQIVSQAAGLNVVEIDIQANDVQVALAPAWTSTPLSAADLAGIQQLLRNTLRTSFLPSNATLPDRVKHLQVKTLPGAGGAVAVLLNMGPTRGAASSLGNVFLRAGDDFALGVGRDFVLAAFAPIVEDLRTRPIAPVSVSAPLLGSGTYTITISGASAALQPGKLVLSVTGHAHGSRWWTPNFDFTTKLAFTLVANGDTIDLVPGDISVDTTSTLVDTFAKSAVERGVRRSRDAALMRRDASGKNTFASVNALLSADRNLGQLLRSLLNPARQRPGAPPPENVFLLLWYTSIDVGPAGLALHGALAVGAWPPAVVEYQPVPAASGPSPTPGGLIPPGPDFSALKAWIPGGVVERFEWSAPGQTQAFVDEHRFILRAPEPGLETAAAATMARAALADLPPAARALPGYTPLCLTVRGSRLSPSGPVVRQPVSGTICGYGTFPVLDAAAAVMGATVALAQPGPTGLVEIVGHAAAAVGATGRDLPNRLVHFADDESAGRLELLTEAVRASGRDDAATAVVAVLTAKQLAGVRHSPDVVYANGDGGAWERAFELGAAARRPTTLLVSPRGAVAWRHEGPVDAATLAAALRKALVAGPAVPRALKTLNLRLGRQVPNLLFEVQPGHALTLRKLAGRPAVLVFWRSTSPASLEEVRARQAPPRDGAAPVVLAINDGEPAELARRAAVAHGFTATLVTDPERTISAAYGVSLWPTTVLVDGQSVATSIAYGRDAHQGRPKAAS